MPRRLRRKCQHVGLVRYVVDDVYDVADLLGLTSERGDYIVRFFSGLLDTVHAVYGLVYGAASCGGYIVCRAGGISSVNYF